MVLREGEGVGGPKRGGGDTGDGGHVSKTKRKKRKANKQGVMPDVGRFLSFLSQALDSRGTTNYPRKLNAVA